MLREPVAKGSNGDTSPTRVLTFRQDLPGHTVVLEDVSKLKVTG